MANSASLGLNCTLCVNFLVPATHSVFVLVTNDKVVNNARVAFPENLNAIKAY